MKKQVKWAAIALIWMLTAALTLTATPALASEFEPEPQPPGYGDPIRVDGSMVVPSGDPGQTVNVVIPLYFSTEFGWNSVRDISIAPVLSTDPEKWPFEIKQTSYTQTLQLSLRRVRPSFSFTISQKAKAGTYPLDFTLTYVAANGSTRETKTNTIRTYVNVLSDGTQVVYEDQDSGQLVLSASPAPSAAYGERVTMTLELRNTGAGLTDVTIKPVITTDLETFPFAVEQQSYEQNIGSFPAGTTREVSYDFLLSEQVTTGAKAVKFSLAYSKNGVRGTGSVTAYVDVSKAKESPGEETSNKPKPKLIISAYNIEPTKIYAGTNFTLEMSFTNTSESPIQNLTIVITNADQENAYVVPAQNGSNTIYVRNLGPGATIQKTLELQVRPDTPAKPNMLSIAMDYEDQDNATYTSSANITVPINQEIRLVMDEPRFDTPVVDVGTTVYPYFNIINMGKSSIYNVMVSVEGQGLSLEEQVYAGTIQAGQQYSVDMGIITSEPGDIAGEIVVSFEDEYGDKQEERRPFSLMVQEALAPDLGGDGSGEGGDLYGPPLPDNGQSGGLMALIHGSGKWWIAGGALLIVVLVVVLLRKRRAKKRLAELTDDDVA